MNKFGYFFAAAVLSLELSASSIDLEITYQEARGGKNVHELQNLVLPDALAYESSASCPEMHKTVFAIKLANILKSSLTEYHAALHTPYDRYPVPCKALVGRPCPGPNPRNWEELRREHAHLLLHNVETLEKSIMATFAEHADVADALLIAKKLSDNMMKGDFGPVFEHFDANYAPMMMGAGSVQAKASAGLNVTSGGVKDYSHFKKQLEDGFVPVPEAFIEEGFLSTFNLSLQSGQCDELISLNPAYVYDHETHKLFIQVGMNSSVTPESFKRPPLNLSFVLDISGSMAATDNTERTRLEWAKDAVSQSLSHLNENDIVSIVVFDSISEVVLPPTAVSNKSLILDKLKKLQPRNSTNLYAGLQDGFLLASKAFKETHENRVILFSDAGLNTGMTDPSGILRLVSDYAGENIGLTAIGVGENFHHDFIHKITMSKGGNALFVHTGADMMKFFKNFDYLVTPVAYNFKLSSELVDLKAKLVNAYGVPMQKDEPLKELINVRTLFFSEEGGAIVLEYEVQ